MAGRLRSITEVTDTFIPKIFIATCFLIIIIIVAVVAFYASQAVLYKMQVNQTKNKKQKHKKKQ